MRTLVCEVQLWCGAQLTQWFVQRGNTILFISLIFPIRSTLVILQMICLIFSLHSQHEKGVLGGRTIHLLLYLLSLHIMTQIVLEVSCVFHFFFFHPLHIIDRQSIQMSCHWFLMGVGFTSEGNCLQNVPQSDKTWHLLVVHSPWMKLSCRLWKRGLHCW